jgi:hypothetical protein
VPPGATAWPACTSDRQNSWLKSDRKDCRVVQECARKADEGCQVFVATRVLVARRDPSS